METFCQRLEGLITSQEMNIAEFERECGLGQTTVQKVLKYPGKLLSLEAIQKISQRFPLLNIHWLITGTLGTCEHEKTEKELLEQILLLRKRILSLETENLKLWQNSKNL